MLRIKNCRGVVDFDSYGYRCGPNIGGFCPGSVRAGPPRSVDRARVLFKIVQY